jgi:hypothetical protein
VSVVDAARAVLAWALAPRGPLPFAHPAMLIHNPRLELLAAPPEEVIAEAGALAATRAAALCWTSPPLGDARPPGVGGVILAAVAAFAPVPPFALALADACPPPAGAWDLVLRDAVASAALGARVDAFTMGETPKPPPQASVADALRARSPLTAVLDRPPPGGEDAAFALVDRLRAHPEGRRALVGAFSAPGAPTAVRRFREGVMDRLRTAKGEEGRELVLSIYEAALVYHGARVCAEIASASALLSAQQLSAGSIDEALAVAAWWGPLRAIRKAWPEELRGRPYLDVEGIIEGTKLHALAQKLVGGAPP